MTKAQPVPRGASEAIRQCWIDPTDAHVMELYSRLPVPGQLALRTRFETLVDVRSADVDSDGLDVGFAQWDEQIALMSAGDAALHRNDVEAARAAFAALAASHRNGQHPLPLIDAETGLGDAERQAGDMGAAVRHYKRALGEARRARARYAEVRAGLALGYAQLESISVRSAQGSFRHAEQVAAVGDWRLERANALVALGECHTRLRQTSLAHRHLLEALAIYESLRSSEGISNACYQLGDACRRGGWFEDAQGWYAQTLAVSAAGSNPIVRVNALDGLAEVKVKSGDYHAARRLFGEAAREAGESGYSRGFAHAIQGLAGVAATSANPTAALRLYRRSRKLYQGLGLSTSEADACAGIARAADALGEPELEVLARLEAVECIERSRAGQVTDADQDEYLERFGHYYMLSLAAAIRHGRISAFLATFEALAGRRLAGMIGSTADPRSVERARLVAQLARLGDEGQRGAVPSDIDHDKALRRDLGRIALRATLPATARRAFDDASAAAYVPFASETAQRVWSTVAQRHENLLLLVDSPDGSQLVWLAKFGEGATPHAGLANLPAETMAMVGDLHRNGLPVGTRLRDLKPLSALLPRELMELLPGTGELAIVPAGRLWSLPWAALVGEGASEERVLGERFALTYAPTVGLLNLTHPSTDRDGVIAWWRSPDVIHHRVEALASLDVATEMASGAEVRRAFLGGDVELMVVVTHGRPVPEMVHYLDLDDGLPITPADMLESIPPQRLALIACWGAGAPGRLRSDPVSIASLALLRGSREVLATTSELVDDVLASRFVNGVLHAALGDTFARAVRASTALVLARPEYRDGPVARWAPLVCIGAGD